MPEDRTQRVLNSDLTSEDLARLRMQRLLGRLGDMKPMPSHVQQILPSQPQNEPLFPQGLKATSIGPPKIGERYLPNPGMPQDIPDALRRVFGGHETSSTTHSQDPMGIEAWAKYGVGDPPYGLMMPGMTRVPPGELPELRAAGKAMLDKILNEGLERREYGRRALTIEGHRDYIKALNDYSNAMGTPGIRNFPERENFPVEPNYSINPDIGDALTFAQQRWPRLFGHASEIADTDIKNQVETGGRTRGAQIEDLTKPGFSKYGFTHGTNFPNATPETVGHELLHGKDEIRLSNFREKYDAATKALIDQGMSPILAYHNNPYEVRARKMGEIFERKFREWILAGKPIKK